jgi:glutamate synthase (NADPH/NADH) small chain
VGKTISAEKIEQDFDAVVLCVGATVPRDLQAPGRELKGIHFAMDFLRTNTKSLLDSEHKDGNYISAEGKNVIVIGGGDTGTDCVGTSLRHHCESVIQLEIMPQPPGSRASSNPWPQWPKRLLIDYGQEESIAVQGADPRDYLVQTTKIEGDENGNVTAVHTVDIEWERTSDGHMIPKEVAGSEKVHPADIILLAMGFMGPEGPLVDQFGLEKDPRSNILAEYDQFATSKPGIFAAGDGRRGQSLIVWAIDEGRRAAREVDSYLMGKSYLP